MKGRDILKGLVDAGKPSAGQASLPTARASGAVRAMNLGLDRLSQEAEAAKDLRAAIAGGANVIEIEPDLIEPSIITDRIESDQDPEYDALKEAIASNDQQVPILVRPHPADAKKYQAAYGHRRIRVAIELGRKVKAIVRQLTDKELVVAQGQENGPRLDLSFIERSLFASKLELGGFDRETVCAALGVDKPEVSRLLTVASQIDASLILAIGPAPKVGRPRWLTLASALEAEGALERAYSVINEERFKKADSNRRFAVILGAVGEPDKIVKTKPRREIQAQGQRVAWIEKTGKRIRLTSERESFSAFLERRLPELVEEFEKSPEASKDAPKKGGSH